MFGKPISIKSIFQLLFLLVAGSLEYQIGLPILFLGLSFEWLLVSQKSDRVLLLLLVSFLWSIFFWQSWALSLAAFGLGLAVLELVPRTVVPKALVIGCLLVVFSLWVAVGQNLVISRKTALYAAASSMTLFLIRRYRFLPTNRVQYLR